MDTNCNSNAGTNNIYIETPLIFSKYLSDIVSQPVFLKLENTQPSGSFKLRGVSELCKKKINEGCKKIVGSSGGNAGLAMAYSAMQLNVPCQLFVPTYVDENMLKKLRSYGAEITVIGHDFKVANMEALKMVDENPEFGFIHPYDHPEIWDGNSTMIQELKVQLNGQKPSCIVASVGGGGLLLGILEGLQKADWVDVPVIAVETEGSECFNKSIKAGEIIEITLTSIAKSLGARSVVPKLMEMYSKFKIVSKVISDKDAVHGCLKFADDHVFLVEPACGVSLAVVYLNLIKPSLEELGIDSSFGPVVVIVCGGSDCTPIRMKEFMKKVGLKN